MKQCRRILLVLLTAAFLLPVLAGCGQKLPVPQLTEYVDFTTGFAQSAHEEDALVKINENDRFILYANLSNGEAAVEDKATGHTWYTNPPDLDQDGLASGFNKNALQSVITLVYTTDLSVDMTCGGFMSSVRKDGLYYRVESDGSVIFFFDFPNEQISVPIRYRIGEDCFTAEVIAHGVSEYGTNTVKSIDLLPFFGAGGSSDEGYMLLPDGSGALIEYNNNRLTAKSYSKTLYGFDNGTSDKVMGSKASSAFLALSEDQHLPVFGVSRNDQGFLAIITEGAARAGINANVAYKYTLYNTVWPTYYYHSIGTVRQTQKDGSENITSAPEKNTEVWQNFKVSYYFLEQGKNTYADMAQCYRSYLVDNEGLQTQRRFEDHIPLYLDLYGYIEKTKSFLGIPVKTRIAMTTLENVNSMLDTLEEAAVENVVVKYNYWSKDSYFDTIPTKTAVDSKVGSKEGMLSLQSRLQGGLYLGADLLNIYQTGRGISQYGDVLRNAANTNQRQYAFSLYAAQIDTRYDAWYLLRPSRIQETFTAYAADMAAAGYENLALDSVGNMLYSELSTNGVGRNQVLGMVSDTIGTVADTTQGLMLVDANDYAAVHADHILQTPSKASSYDLEDHSVPFYQMVFHGCLSYSLDPVNLASNPADTTLRHLEYGASPLFSLIGQNGDELIGSRMDRLYSADAANWMDFMIAQYAQIDEALSGVQGALMVGHEILSEDVRVVTYDNGTQIYINYGQTSVNARGVTLEPKGYAVLSGGEILVCGQAAGE